MDIFEKIMLGIVILFAIGLLFVVAKVIMVEPSADSCGGRWETMNLKENCYELTRFYSTGAVANTGYKWVLKDNLSEKCRCSWNIGIEPELYYDYQNKTGRFENCSRLCSYTEA